jgi:tetratricopeptide (TPR) repeat protein
LAGAGAGVLAVLGYGAYRLRSADFHTQVYVLVAATSLGMVLHIVPLPVSVTAADRYLYLPSAALVLALAPSVVGAAKRWRWVVPAVLAVLLACGVRTFERVHDFTDAGRFWAAAVRSAPGDPLSYVGLGSVAYDAGLLKEAHDLYARGLGVPHGRLRVALDNTALLAAVTGRRAEAARLCDELVAKAPSMAIYRLRRATIAFNALDLELAQKHARQALELDPALTLARRLLVWLAEAKAAGVGRPGSAVPTATALRVDMQALRYPELLATVRSELASPRAGAPIVREAVEYVIARGRPEDARELVELYVAAAAAPDAAKLREATALRLQAAAELRSHLQTLPAR